MTLQNPQYKNYSYQVFGQNYSYSNNLIPELSKTLIEFDPSYYIENSISKCNFADKIGKFVFFQSQEE